MNALRDLENYLATMAKLEQSGSAPAKIPISLPFISISRQTGAGAYALAETLLAMMATEKNEPLLQGWQLVDDQLCEELLRHEKLQNSMQSMLSEEYHSQIGEFVLGLFGRQVPQDTAIMQQSKLIRSLASLGKTIIVGRAASQVAKGLEQGIHIRLVAAEAVRIKSIMKRSGKSESEARHYIHEQDQERTWLLKDHYRVDIDNVLLYDAIWNTGMLDLETIAAALIAMIKQRQSR